MNKDTLKSSNQLRHTVLSICSLEPYAAPLKMQEQPTIDVHTHSYSQLLMSKCQYCGSHSKEALGAGPSFATVLEDQRARIGCGTAYVELHPQLGVELVVESPLSRNITVPQLTRHCGLQLHM